MVLVPWDRPTFIRRVVYRPHLVTRTSAHKPITYLFLGGMG